jgi:uncharacterized protein YcbK (DUF882 family)
MDEDGATLGVGFAIDFHDSFGRLKSLDDLIGATTANAVREFQRLEAAGNGSLNLAGATTQLKSFGNAVDRETMVAERSFVRVEKAGEALVRQLERQNASFGKTREELQAMKVDAQLAANAQQGLTEQSSRLIALQSELTGKRQQAEYGSQATALRAQLDPMFAAQQRFNKALDQADDLFRAGAITAREYAAAQNLAREALQQHAKAVAGTSDALQDMARPMGIASGNARQLSLQMSQVAQQVMAGTGVIQALAMQLPDVAAGMNASAGGASKFATFLGGPWGIAVTAAIGLAATFGMKMLESDDATKKAEKTQRSFVDVMRDSKASYVEVTKAARDYADAQAKARETTLQTIRAEAEAIALRMKKTIEDRKNLDVTLRLAEAEAHRVQELSRSPNAAKEGFGTFDALKSGQALLDIQAKIAANQKILNETSRDSREIVIKTAQAIAELNTDPPARARAGYDELERQAQRRYKSVEGLAAALTSLGKSEQAELDRLNEANRKHADDTIKLAKVTGAEIAKALGAPITSGLRSVAKNKAVGGDENSHHLTGTAIDIPLSVNGKPFSKAGIRAALAPLGVEIKELLGPGDRGHNDHFHIAFGVKRLAPEQVRDLQEDAAEAARKAAEKAEDEMQKFRIRIVETSYEMQGSLTKTLLPGMLAAEQKAWEEFMTSVDKAADAGVEGALSASTATAEWNGELRTTIDMLDQIGESGRALGDIGGALMGLMTGDFSGSRGPLGGILQSIGNIQWRGAANDNGLGEIKVLREEIVSGLDEVFGGKGTFANTLNEVFKGAGTGSAIGGALFSKSAASQFGSTAGGALGQAAGAELGKSLTGFLSSAAGPLGSIIGSLAGGLLGGLLQKTKKGTATFTEAGLSSIAGNSNDRISGAKNAGNSALDAFNDILTRLDATASNIKFSTGIRKESFVLDPTGAGRTKGAGVLNFGKDEQAYMEAVVREIFADASFTGLSAGFAKLLKSGGDIEKQIEKVFSLKGAFDELASIKDPQGFALGNLDKEFDKLRAYAVEAGEGLAQVEELYGLKRKEIADKFTTDTLELDRTRRGMEAELLRLSGDEIGATAIARQLEREQLDPSLGALYDQIAARQVEAAALQAAAAIEKARTSLRIELLEAQGKSEEALALTRQQQLADMDPLLRGLREQVWTAQDAAKAQQELADAQKAAADAAREAQETAVNNLLSLRERLLQAQGNDAGLKELRRSLEYEKAGAGEREALDLIYKAEDAKERAAAAEARRAEAKLRADEARQKAEDIARQTTGFQVDILRSLGKEEAAVAKEREAALKAMDPALRKWQQAAWYVADTAGKLTRTVDTFGRLGESLREYRDGLYAADQATGASYRQLQVDFLKTAALAQAGDETALGKLTGVGSAFLDGARANATSEIQLARDLALVARSVDAAIGATDDAVDYAKDQLSALELLVTGQATTNTTLADIKNSAPIAVTPKGAESLADAVIRMNASSSKSDGKLDRIVAATEKTAQESEDTNKKYFARVVDNDAIKTRERA